MTTGTASRRNYRAMKEAKLVTVERELRIGGDARQRCVNGGFDPQADLDVVHGVMREKGIAIPDDGNGERVIDGDEEDSPSPRFIGAHLAAKSPADPTPLFMPHLVMEPKLDGWWVQLYHAAEGDVRIWARSGDEIQHRLPHVVEEFSMLEPGTRVVGELVIAGGATDGGSRLVHQLMRRTSKDPSGAGTRPLSVVAFDCLENVGEDLTASAFVERRRHLENVCDALDSSDHTNGSILLVRQDMSSENTYAEYLQLGFEGAIVKDPGHVYIPGQRGKGQTKIKAEDTVDVVVMGVMEGNGELAGTTGSLIIGQFDDDLFLKPTRRGSVSSGLDRAERDRIWAHQGATIGRVLELRHMGCQAGGFRHPTFLRWRDDLDARAVTWHDGR